MEVEHKGFTVKDDGTVINKFGRKVGHKQKNGYMYVTVCGKQILMHRFVWEAFNGEIPDGMEIDHINTIRSDNRLENMRLVTSKENKHNPITLATYKISNKGKITDALKEKIAQRKKYDFPKDRKEYYREYWKLRWKTNKDELKEQKKQYYQAHKEEIQERKKQYYQAHKEEAKQYYQDNKERIKSQRKEHKGEARKRNEYFKQYMREYRKRKKLGR